MPTDWMIVRQARPAIRGVMSWYQRRPLEASAVVLLGLGGVIYPPVWLLGAAFALASQPVGLPGQVGRPGPAAAADLIGTALGVTRGGHVSVGEDVHEGWV